METIRLLCVKGKAKNLREGYVYYGKLVYETDKTVLRVKDDSGRWSKYGMDTFVAEAPAASGWVYMGGRTVSAEEFTALKGILTESPVYSIREAVETAEEKLETILDEEGEDLVDDDDELGGFIGDFEEDVHAEIRTFEPERAVAPKAVKTIVKEDIMKGSLNEALLKQGVPEYLIKGLAEWRKQFTVDDNVKHRIPQITQLYEDAKVWSQCITAILSGKHILLSAGKATGKNTLARSLSFACQRPEWDASFHTNIGADELIGTETFKGGEVTFNPGIAYLCGLHGGFGVLDEINMAKDNAISVLNIILDDRRLIDVPGYEILELHPATRFIGTMNYGYAGTRALNEALVSRFVLPDVRELNQAELVQLLAKKYKGAKVDALKLYAGIFEDLQKKAKSAEISTATVDLRGIIDALAMTELGMNPNEALNIALVNKAFEEFERVIVKDVVKTRIPPTYTTDMVFGSTKAFVVDFGKEI